MKVTVHYPICAYGFATAEVDVAENANVGTTSKQMWEEMEDAFGKLADPVKAVKEVFADKPAVQKKGFAQQGDDETYTATVKPEGIMGIKTSKKGKPYLKVKTKHAQMGSLSIFIHGPEAELAAKNLRDDMEITFKGAPPEEKEYKGHTYYEMGWASLVTEFKADPDDQDDVPF